MEFRKEKAVKNNNKQIRGRCKGSVKCEHSGEGGLLNPRFNVRPAPTGTLPAAVGDNPAVGGAATKPPSGAGDAVDAAAAAAYQFDSRKRKLC